MDLFEAIDALYAERERLNKIISALEMLEGKQRMMARRGRKSMGAAERHAVSLRMKKYWAKRKTADKLPAQYGGV